MLSPMSVPVSVPASVRVRARRPSDLGACLEMAQLVKGLDGYPPRGPVDLERFMAPPQELAAWVAETDSGVVGHVALHRTGAGVTMAMAAAHTGRASEQLAVVARLFVGPAARRGGAARALLHRAVADAHARGLQPVLDVAMQLGAAVDLYESCRWRRAGVVTIEFDGAEFDEAPSLDCFVYVGPAPSEDAADVTRP
jgi:GNAT superfamily N-acetyltransferase